MSTAGLILVSVARLHAFVPGLAAVRPGLLVSIIALLALLNGAHGTRSIGYLKSPLGYTMAFFVVWAVASAPFALYPGRAVGFLTGQFLREALIILVLAAAVRDVTDLKRLLAVFGFGVVAFSILAQGTGRRGLHGGGYDANDSAMFVVSGIPLIFYFFVRARNIKARLLFGFGLTACGAAVVLSGSRGGFLGLAAVLLYSLFFLKGVKPAARIAVITVAVGTVLIQANGAYWDRMQTITDENDYNRDSYTGRIEVWKRGIGYLEQNPLLGVGVDNFSVAEGRNPLAVARLDMGKGVKFSAPHSIWIQVASEMGFPGIIALVAMFVLSFRILWTADRLGRGTARGRAPPELEQLGELGRPLMGVLVGVAVSGSFLSRAYSSIVWMPLGLALAVWKLGRIRELEARRARRKHALTFNPRGGAAAIPGSAAVNAPQRGPRE